ncbi:MAG: acyltransferase [Candidatus Omnitrophota bacterium]
MKNKTFVQKVKNGQPPFYSLIKSAVLFILNFRIPLFWPLTWFYRALYFFHVFLRESVVVLLKIIYFEPMIRAVCVKVGRNLRLEKLPYIVGNGSIELGDNVRISGRIDIGFNNRFGHTPQFIVGNNVFIGCLCGFAAAKKIEIGNNCYLASGVKIFDNDGHPLDPQKRRQGEPVSIEDVQSVKLCDNVWVGTGGVILKGVTIGENSVVGAGSIITKDVPANTIVAGNPARIIKVINQDAS